MKCGLGLTATIGGSKLYKPSAVAVLFAVVAFVYQILSSNVVQAPTGDTTPGQEGPWEFLGDIDGVRTYQRKQGASNLLAFRGVMDVDLHIDAMIGAFFDLSVTKRWVDMLDFINEHPPLEARDQSDTGGKGRGGGGAMAWLTEGRRSRPVFGANVMHQVCSLPPPMAKREFVMARQVTFNSDTKTMQADYHSVDDPRFPVSNGVVRAETPHTQWTFTSFTATDGRRMTTMALESVVDTKLPIPQFILNYMQRFWPAKSLNAFKRICREEGHRFRIDPDLLPKDLSRW